MRLKSTPKPVTAQVARLHRFSVSPMMDGVTFFISSLFSSKSKQEKSRGSKKVATTEKYFAKLGFVDHQALDFATR